MLFSRSFSVFGGTAIAVAMRWTDRLIGLISTLILARLLAPEDFGIIAMASLAIALADVLVDLGVNTALIQNRNATQAHYDTAWTLRLVQTSIATLALVLAAPLAAEYFRDPQVQPVLQVLAFTLLLSGLENIGIVAFHKHMQFGAEFRFLFLRRMTGFIATIIAAWLLRSYWALVIGALTGRLAGVGLSYWLHPMRPRLSFEKFGEIFAISQWMLLRSIGAYLHHNLHKMLVGRWASTATMGAYSLADDISAMPTGELLAPLNRVLFPAFADAREHLAELKRLFLLAQGIQTLVAIPAAVGLALVADEMVRFLLGEKWLAVVPFIQILALVNIAGAITTSSGYVLIVLGKIRNSVLNMWIQVAVFAGLALTLFAGSEALEIAWLRLYVGIGGIGLSLWMILRALPVLGLRDVFRSTVRPFLGAAGMVMVLVYALPDLQLPLAMVLAIKVLLGAMSYVTVVGVLWGLAGRPEGAEAYLLDKARSIWAQRRAKFQSPDA